jgi:hypothetical protein
MREKYQSEIENRIAEFEMGHVFSATDFADLADTDPANKALSRLCEAGKIRRVMKGLYDKPIYSSVLKEFSSPVMDNVAKALARRYNWTIAPAGETALNLLHMSTQVPNTWCYISDGPYRDYEISPYRIEFKHCANREISGKSQLTVIVIQAIKYIGKDNARPEDIERLSRAIPVEEKDKILKESMTTTSWIYRVIKEACSD